MNKLDSLTMQFKSYLQLGVMLKLLLLSQLSMAALTKEQTKIIADLGVKNYQLILDTKEYKVVSSEELGIFTFFGESNIFSNTNKLFQLKDGHLLNLLNLEFVKDAKVSETKFTHLLPEAGEAKDKLYVVYSSNCPICRNFIKDAQTIANNGIEIVFIPHVAYANEDDRLKQSYILSLPNQERLAALNTLPAEMKLASKENPDLVLADNLVKKYALNQYPVFYTADGKQIIGYENLQALLDFIRS